MTFGLYSGISWSVKIHVPHGCHLTILPACIRGQRLYIPHSMSLQLYILPDDHVGHFIRCPKLLIVDSNYGDDPGNILNELLVSSMEVLEVVQRNGGFTLSLSHLNPSLALLGANIKMNNQVGLLPIYHRERNKGRIIIDGSSLPSVAVLGKIEAWERRYNPSVVL